MSKTGYIAGPMSGLHALNFKNFFYWQVALENSGYKIINPAEIDTVNWLRDGYDPSKSYWEECLKVDLELIESDADFIFVLDGWEDSKGAKLEIKKAKALGLEVYYEGENK
jgi:hypothetical protein